MTHYSDAERKRKREREILQLESLVIWCSHQSSTASADVAVDFMYRMDVTSVEHITKVGSVEQRMRAGCDSVGTDQAIRIFRRTWTLERRTMSKSLGPASVDWLLDRWFTSALTIAAAVKTGPSKTVFQCPPPRQMGVDKPCQRDQQSLSPAQTLPAFGQLKGECV